METNGQCHSLKTWVIQRNSRAAAAVRWGHGPGLVAPPSKCHSAVGGRGRPLPPGAQGEQGQEVSGDDSADKEALQVPRPRGYCRELSLPVSCCCAPRWHLHCIPTSGPQPAGLSELRPQESQRSETSRSGAASYLSVYLLWDK